MREGLGTRLILRVDLTDTSALRLPGLHPGSPTTHSFLPSFSSLQCLGVPHTVPGLLALFLVVEQPLLHPKVHNHPAHSTLASSNSAALLPWLLRRPTMEHKSLHLSQHCVFVGPRLDLLGYLRRYSVQILHEQEEVTRDWNDCRSLRKWQTA